MWIYYCVHPNMQWMTIEIHCLRLWWRWYFTNWGKYRQRRHWLWLTEQKQRGAVVDVEEKNNILYLTAHILCAYFYLNILYWLLIVHVHTYILFILKICSCKWNNQVIINTVKTVLLLGIFHKFFKRRFLLIPK